MLTITRRRFVTLATLTPVADAAAQLIGNSGGGWSVRGTDPIEIFHGDRMITSYHAGYDTGQPHFHPVVGPSGELFTTAVAKTGKKDTPPRSREGLWFALGNLNGYDFRQAPGGAPVSDRKPGDIRHRGVNGVIVKDSVIVLRTRSEWFDAGDKERRICSDRREFTLFYREDGSLVIEIELELMADAGDLEIGPESEGGWSAHVGPGLSWKEAEPGRALASSEGLTGKEVLGSKAKWVACQGHDAGGKVAGVAVLDHPGNPGFPAHWSIDGAGLISANPFKAPGQVAEPDEKPGSEQTAEAAPSRNFRLHSGESDEKLPRVIPNGESLLFRYRTVFYTGELSSIDLDKASEAFSAR